MREKKPIQKVKTIWIHTVKPTTHSKKNPRHGVRNYKQEKIK